MFTSGVCLGVVVALGLTDDTYCFLMASFSLHICFSVSLIAVKLFVISAECGALLQRSERFETAL